LKILLPVVKRWMFPPSLLTPLPASTSTSSPLRLRSGSLSVRSARMGEGDVIALIKPQFEAGRKDVSRGDGVIRDPEIHKQVLLDVLGFAQREGFSIRGLIKSPLLGPKGNAEFLVWLDEVSEGSEDIISVVEQVLEKSQGS